MDHVTPKLRKFLLYYLVRTLGLNIHEKILPGNLLQIKVHSISTDSVHCPRALTQNPWLCVYVVCISCVITFNISF